MMQAFAAAALLLLPAPAEATAGAVPAPEEQFDSLVSEIGVLRTELQKLDRKEEGIVAEMDRLQLEADLRERELAKLRIQGRRAARELEDNEARLEALAIHIDREESQLARQLREVYTTGRQQDLRVFLAVEDPSDILRAVTYLDVVARRQSGIVESLRDSRAEAEILETALRTQTRSLAQLERQQEAKAGELREVLARAGEVLSSTREQRDAHRRAIEELTRAAEELEAAIVRGEALGATAATVDPGKLKGVLEWPVEGTVAVPFGDIHHPRFGTVTPHPGLEIETGAGADIRAVLGGTVVFSRRFSGYGNTILLDHGAGYLSVYARAAVMQVREGDVVLTGQKLGSAAGRSLEGGPPRVYFEFRQQGKAVDPAAWLRSQATYRGKVGR